MSESSYFGRRLGQFMLLGILNLSGLALAQQKQQYEAPENFFQLSAKSIDGVNVEFSEYRGKVILAVNVASQCGYTPQYSGLEKLYEKYKGQGFLILGFPSNDFGGQEPGSDAEIKKFCKLKYEVNFPIFAKGPVSGDSKTRIYKFLTESASTEKRGEVQWNFEKFLLNRQGHVVNRFRSAITPEDSDLLRAIEKEMKSK